MKNYTPVSVSEDNNNNTNNESTDEIISMNSDSNSSSSANNPCTVRRVVKATVLFAAIVFACVVLLSCASFRSFSFLPLISFNSTRSSDQIELDNILRSASMGNKTVIMTTLNGAWAEPNSIFDLFLKSFRMGKETKGLLRHLVVICLDDKAYSLCTSSHRYCYQLRTKGINFTEEAFFMNPDYLEMMWIRIKFLGSVLEMGYSFVFTDADIMWLGNPFRRFFPKADFQIACDSFNGNSDDLNNFPNGGFAYVRSNEKTIKFYEFWYSARWNYSRKHDQDVLNKIKFNPFIKEIGLNIRFLDTAYFGGFCEPSLDLNKVCTMHANCCVGIKNKVNDLAMLLEDWKRFTSSMTPLNPKSTWSVPKNCSTSFQRMNEQKSKH